MPKVVLQAGHHPWTSRSGHQYPPGGGAPGEAAWAYKLAGLILERLNAAGVDATIIGHWHRLPAPPEAADPADLFVSLHYDGATYGPGENTGCFADTWELAASARYARGLDFIRAWEVAYAAPGNTGIWLRNGRRNPNTRRYYAFAGAVNCAAVALIEHGCGAPVSADGLPPGQDAALLHGGIDRVAAADAAAILAYLKEQSMRSKAWVGEWPVTQVFGVNPAAYARFGLKGHNGLDLGMPPGTPLLAPEAGRIVEAYSDPGGYGLTVYLAAHSGRGWRFGHASQLHVAVDDLVDAGGLLAHSGNTGNSTGPHLHLGVRPAAPDFGNGFNGYTDPLPVLAALDAAPVVPVPPAEEPEDMGVIDELNKQVADLRAEIDGLNGQQNERERQIAALREELAARQADVARLTADLEAGPPAAARLVSQITFTDGTTQDVAA